jgi:RNA polymerase sigma factor (sigma-70 family)
MEQRADRFRRLLEPQHDRALAFARSISRLTSEGDDLFQDAMLHAFKKLDALRDDAAFRPWLYRIIINAHRSRVRRVFWRRLVSSTPADAAQPDDELYRTEGWTPQAAEANRRARTALAKLPPDVREAIVLFEIEGWTIEEIATLERGTLSCIKSRLARGRARLRELYGEQPALLAQGDPT